MAIKRSAAAPSLQPAAQGKAACELKSLPVGGRYCEDCHVAELTNAGLMEVSAGVRPCALDAERAKALWAKSEEWTGERF